MKSTIFSLITVVLFALVTGCSPRNKSELVVSTSFAFGDGAFNAGLMIYGEGPNNQKFSVTSSTDSTVRVTLTDGQWKIYGVGYTGTVSSKLEGSMYCGTTTVNLTGSTTDIKLTMTTNKCDEAATISELGITGVKFKSCSAFYQYNPTGLVDNMIPTYENIDGLDPDFCLNNPSSDLNYRLPYYKVVANEINGTQVLSGVSTACRETDAPSSTFTKFPAKKFPFTLKFYKSIVDCENFTSTRFAKYDFNQGIALGNPASFDHTYILDSDNDRLVVLPSTFTRRGLSPFMEMIPRLTCGGSECIEDFTAAIDTSTTAAVDHRVEWDDWGSQHNDRNQVLIKDAFKLNLPENASCSSVSPALFNLLNSDINLSLKDCRIKGGHVTGRFERNSLFCRNNGELDGIVKMHEANGLLYLTFPYDANTSRIKIMDSKGLFFGEIYVPVSGLYVLSLTTDSNKHLYVLTDEGGVNRRIYKYPYDTSKRRYSDNPSFWVINSTTNSHLQSAHLIQWHGSIFTWAVGTALYASSGITSSSASTPHTFTRSSWTGPSIHKVLSKSGKYYALIEYSSNSNNQFYEITFSSSLAITATVKQEFTSNEGFRNFHVSNIGTDSYVFLIPLSPAVNGTVYKISGGTYTEYISNPFSPDSGYWGGEIISVGNRIFRTEFVQSTTNSTFYSSLLDVSTPAFNDEVTNNVCEANFDLTPFNFQTLDLVVKTKDTSNFYYLMNDLLRNVGRSHISDPKAMLYFEALNDDHGDMNPRTAGRIARAQEMLGPQGLGGIISGLYPGKTCNEIPSGNHTVSIYGPFEGDTRRYNISIIRPLSPPSMEPYICESQGACGTTDKYNFIVNINSLDNPDDLEKLKLKLRCGSKQGSLESYEYEKNKERERELLLWSFNDEDKARWEEYQHDTKLTTNDTRVSTRTSVTTFKRIQTTTNNFILRTLEIDHSGSNFDSPSTMEGRIHEIHGASSILQSMSTYVPQLPINDFSSTNSASYSNPSFTIGNIVSSKDLFMDLSSPTIAYQSECINRADSDPDVSTSTCTSSLVDFTSYTWAKRSASFFNLEALKSFTTAPTGPGAIGNLGIFEISQ